MASTVKELIESLKTTITKLEKLDPNLQVTHVGVDSGGYTDDPDHADDFDLDIQEMTRDDSGEEEQEGVEMDEVVGLLVSVKYHTK